MDSIARLNAIANGEPSVERLTRLSGQAPLTHGVGAWVFETIGQLETNLNVAVLRCALVVAAEGVPIEVRAHHLRIQELIGQTLEAVRRTRDELHSTDWGL